MTYRIHNFILLIVHIELNLIRITILFRCLFLIFTLVFFFPMLLLKLIFVFLFHSFFVIGLSVYNIVLLSSFYVLDIWICKVVEHLSLFVVIVLRWFLHFCFMGDFNATLVIVISSGGVYEDMLVDGWIVVVVECHHSSLKDICLLLFFQFLSLFLSAYLWNTIAMIQLLDLGTCLKKLYSCHLSINEQFSIILKLLYPL